MASRTLPRPLCVHSALQLRGIRTGTRRGGLAVHLGATALHIRVHGGRILEIECDYLVNEGEGKRGELVVQHFGGVAVTVELHDVAKTDAMSSDVDEAVSILGEEF